MVDAVLWGGPLDGQIVAASDPPQAEMAVPLLDHWPPVHGADLPEIVRHHYVFDEAAHRYNYAGDWP